MTRTAEAFERAPLLAERVTDGDPDVVIARAREVIAGLSDAQKAAILDAHPRIGADSASLSAVSEREQGDEDDPDVLRELAQLNDAYERRFGFRCVIFVHGRGKRDLVPVLRARLRRTREQELATGIEEFLSIARDRLQQRP